MEHKVKALQETKTIFNELKTDPKSALLSIEKLETKLLKKLKKNKQLLKLIDFLENNIKKINNDKVPIRLDYIKRGKLIDVCFIALMVLFSSCLLTSPI